jgi:hypothetical protein
MGQLRDGGWVVSWLKRGPAVSYLWHIHATADMLLQVTGAAAAVVTLCVLAAACGDREPLPQRNAEQPRDACDDAAARVVVERFGERMKDVSLLAPDSLVRLEMRAAYGPLVAPDLLDVWLADPVNAPGRLVSSPWPDRIDVRSVTGASPGECRVEGDVVYVTSADTGAAADRREDVVISVHNVDGWRITAYEAPAADATPSGSDSRSGAALPDTAAAIAIIEQYYAAINSGEYRRAYSFWSDSGAASGLSFEEFTEGFAETAEVHVEVGAPGRIEGAAGSRYVTLPVVITAVTADGARQSFAGTYTLRRGVVDGATAEQRSWRIHSADIARR